MTNTRSTKTLLTISGILLILAGAIELLYMLVKDFNYLRNILCGYASIDWEFLLIYLSDIFLIISGIFVIIKKNFIPVAIGFGAVALFSLYYFTSMTASLLDYYEDSIILILICVRDAISFITFSLLTALSIVSITNPRCKVLKLGFIPGILAGLNFVLYICQRIISIFIYRETFGLSSLLETFMIWIPYFLFIAVGVLLYGLALGRFSPLKEEDSQENIGVIYTYTPPAEPVSEMPAFIPPAAPSSEAVYAEKDIAAELRKYKAMLDEGLITQEDYDKKKAHFLGN